MKEHKPTYKKIDFTTLPEIQYEPRYFVSVLDNQEVVPDVIVVHFDRPKNFTFQPGQYIWLVLPKRSQKYEIVDRRAYSISSGKDDKVLELLIRLTGSDYLNDVQKLKKGDSVEIIGPMGSSFVPSDSGAIFVAGGTGISPFLSILRSKPKNKFSLYGFESPERPLYAKEQVVKLAQSQGYIVKFFSGPATPEHFRRISTETDDRPIFIAGPQSFVNRVFRQLLRLGIKEERMYFEACYPEDKQNKTIKEIFKIKNSKKTFEENHSAISLSNIFSQISYQTSNQVIFTDRNGVILYANDAARNITGYSLHEMFGQTPRLWGGLMSSTYYKTVWNHLKKGVAFKRTVLNRAKNGRLYVALGTISPIYKNKNILGYVAPEEDITEEKELDKAKTEFVSLASHQLRTPLTTVKWYTEALLHGDSGRLNKAQKEQLKQISQGNDRTIELVNGLLTVSQLDLGTFPVEKKKLNLKDLVLDLIQAQEPQIKMKHIQLKTNFSKTSMSLNTDEKLVRMIIQNLISNAVKYTDMKGSIVVNLGPGKSSGEFLLSISDNGFGISKDQQDKIFSKLFRADNARENVPDGNGLGLYIVKKAVESLGGKIWFESEENKGSTFFVLLPKNITPLRQ